MSTTRATLASTSDAQHSAGNQPISPADKLRADASRNLKAARASLQANNLSATKTRLAAAAAAQPGNRDAQRLRSAVHTREEQRDAFLSLARGCGYVGHWTCVSHNASNALEIDSSSKEAQRLLTMATQRSELQIPPPVEAPPEPPPPPRDLLTHH
ncbi:hypothetical protein [Paraburkholderia sp. RAU2J]|uniref:hypothetical protein n=1 Tax=Paraburkholderia sp. RAU2J TaxID=1938810 RepID=UPI0011C481A8|nr:hypothetical protein [Paraburkholderia sp. RAU2J]